MCAATNLANANQMLGGQNPQTPWINVVSMLNVEYGYYRLGVAGATIHIHPSQHSLATLIMRGVGETFVSKQALRFLGPSAQGRRNARVKASLRSTSRNICMDGLFTSKPRMMWARTLYICGLKKGTIYSHVCNDHAGGPSMYIYMYFWNTARIYIYIHAKLCDGKLLTPPASFTGPCTTFWTFSGFTSWTGIHDGFHFKFHTPENSHGPQKRRFGRWFWCFQK